MNTESNRSIRERLKNGNARYRALDDARRIETAENGQHPYAIVVCCSDSRVIPEKIFSAGLGELFVIRVAGNVLDKHQFGSIEYAAAHLHCSHILVLGHTGCGAVTAALSGGWGKNATRTQPAGSTLCTPQTGCGGSLKSTRR